MSHFKVNNLVAFSALTMFCNHHLYLVPKHFHQPKGKPVLSHFSHFSSPQPLASNQPTFCAMDWFLLDISYKLNHTICESSVSGFLHLAECFQGSSTPWHSFHFYGWRIFYWMNMPPLVDPLRVSGLFPVLGYGDQCCYKHLGAGTCLSTYFQS